MFGELAPPAEDYKTVEYTEYKNAQVMSPPDMPDYLLDYILTKANELLDGEGGSDSQVVATALKRDLDERWQPYWHVTVGKNFASHVVHQKRRFVYFVVGKTAFLVYKAQ